MAKRATILDKMQANPQGDWTIENVKALAKRERLEVRSPKGGSHYVLSSPFIRDSLCVPYKRPIKAKYIKDLVGFVIAHREYSVKAKEGK